MSDYIKREDAIETVYKLREHFKCWDRNDDIIIKNALNAIPTADVVEVVRCNDCKYGEVDDADFPDQYFCNHHGCDWNEGNHYCSYGERK